MKEEKAWKLVSYQGVIYIVMGSKGYEDIGCFLTRFIYILRSFCFYGRYKILTDNSQEWK